MPDIIPFHSRADLRTFAEIDADQAEWERVVREISRIIETSWLGPAAQASATMCALLDHTSDVLPDIKLVIALALEAREGWER